MRDLGASSTILFIPGCVRDRFLIEKPLDSMPHHAIDQQQPASIGMLNATSIIYWRINLATIGPYHFQSLFPALSIATS